VEFLSSKLKSEVDFGLFIKNISSENENFELMLIFFIINLRILFINSYDNNSILNYFFILFFYYFLINKKLIKIYL